MSRALALWLALPALVACRPAGTPAPPVPPVETADAGAWPLFDLDATGALGAPCATACVVLALVGCSAGAQPDCVAVLSHIDGAGELRTPSGAPLTCEAIAESENVDEVRAIGVQCP